MNTLLILLTLLDQGSFTSTHKIQCDIKHQAELIGEAETNKAIVSISESAWNNIESTLDETWDMDDCE